ncbi:reverse transcriptase domain-containing protein [Tanacetum coccineum]
MCIELANKSTQIPRGIAENVIVKIDRFVFPVDFVVLDMKEDRKIPIILGRPFLATTHAMIDVFTKKISFEVRDETITFDVEKSMRFPPSDDDTCHYVDMIDLSILDHVQEILPLESFDSLLFEPVNHHLPTQINSLWDDNEGEHDLINQISRRPDLSDFREKELLLGVLAKHKSALAWKVADIKNIIPSFCTHKILMEDNFKPVVQPQCILNPKVQDVVKAKILKLLNADLIYVISDNLWEKFHFMVKEGIVLGHKISKAGIEVDKAKVDVIAKSPYPTNIKGIRSFLGNAGFYKRFIKDFSKIARPMTQLLMKDTKFVFSSECIKSIDILRNKLTTAPIIIAPNWNLDFKLMCDASDYAVGAEFTIKIKDKKGLKNLAVDHLSRLENIKLEELDEDGIRDSFPDEHLVVINIKERKTTHGPTGGHYGVDITARKVFESGFYWPNIFKDSARTVNENMKEWADKLDDALWAFRTAYKSPIGSTPFRIVYEKACHLPIEMEHKAYWALKKINLDLYAAEKHRYDHSENPSRDFTLTLEGPQVV